MGHDVLKFLKDTRWYGAMPSCFCVSHDNPSINASQGTVDFDDKHLIVDGHKIRLFHEMDPANIKWCVTYRRCMHASPFSLITSPHVSRLSGPNH